MKVRCVRLINEQTGASMESSHWLTVGRTYIVLEIISRPNGIKYRLLGDGDSQTPALHQIGQFEIVSNAIPKGWVVHIKNDVLAIGPSKWYETNFWDAYFDGDIRAVKAFEDTCEAMAQEQEDAARRAD